MNFFFAIFAALCGISLACSPVEVVDNFDSANYLGHWYEYSRINNTFERNAKCVTATYSLKDDGSIKVLNKAINETTGDAIQAEGSAILVKNGTKGQLQVSFAEPSIKAFSTYNILGTDYKNWASVYSCISMKGQEITFAWVLTREKEPSQEVVRAALAAFTAQHIDTSKLWVVDQSCH